MSEATALPRDWHVAAITRRRKGNLFTTFLVQDAHGRIVAELPEDGLSHDEQRRNADLICNAVNRHNYLRDLVRRLADLGGEASFLLNDKGSGLLREARAAIGEVST